jgi:hypothetical protein
MLTLLAAALVHASPPVAVAHRTAAAVVVDGRLTEPAWADAPPQRTFHQRLPHARQPPNVATEFRVLYDNRNLYVGVHCLDPSPSQILGRLSRRDRGPESDMVQIDIDSRHDGRSAYRFIINAAGAQADELLFDDTNASREWDGVWQSAVNTDATGWTVEFAISWSELRFAPSAETVMGLQVQRHIPRMQENDVWSPAYFEDGGWVSRFGELRGLRGLPFRPYVVVTPFVGGGLSHTGDTFEGGTPGPGARRPSVGMDARLGLSGDLTLDATVMPDFGQVESDEAVINLGQFETFFPEKRPFFQEGRDLFSPSDALGGSLAANQVVPFYSRRLGANKPILGAAKVTGRVGEHVTVALLDALEWPGLDGADLQELDSLSVQRATLQTGETSSGVMMTQALRPGARMGDKPSTESFMAGADTAWKPDHGNYLVSAVAMGTVQADEMQVVGRRRGQAPLGQAGAGGKVRVRKTGGGVVGGLEYEAYTPAFDISDMGYQQRADLQHLHADVGLRSLDYSQFFSLAVGILNADAVATFDGQPLRAQVSSDNFVVLHNRWVVGGGLVLQPPSLDDLETLDHRALIKRPATFGMGMGFESDPGQDVQVSGGGFVNKTDRGFQADVGAGLMLAPLARLQFNFNGGVGQRNGEIKLVWDDNVIYVLARRNVTYANAVGRATLALTRDLSLQNYTQFVVEDGQYQGALRAVKDTDARPTLGRRQVLDPATLPSMPNSALEDTAFHSSSLVSQAILRFEFRPGSTLYLVFIHRALDSATHHAHNPVATAAALANPRNVEERLEAKLSFRLGL